MLGRVSLVLVLVLVLCEDVFELEKVAIDVPSTMIALEEALSVWSPIMTTVELCRLSDWSPICMRMLGWCTAVIVVEPKSRAACGRGA